MVVGRTLLCLVTASYAHAQVLQVTSFVQYPNSSTTAVIAGALQITPVIVNGTLQHKLTWKLTGTDDVCNGTVDSGDVCGIHVHVGKDCADEDTIGGHLLSKDNSDPWTAVRYTSEAGVSTEVAGQSVETGLTSGEIVNRVVVVHNSVWGERIACGVLTFVPTTTTTTVTTTTSLKSMAQLSLAYELNHVSGLALMAVALLFKL